jgi:ABC-type multidrug transport system ATPase subunit
LTCGQAQRINVARAFLKNAPILLLDEATSSLDSVAEANVQEAIDRLLKARTSFVVAHRLFTLRNADRLLVLDGGRLVAFGGHEQLLGDCELYRRIWESQQLNGPIEYHNDRTVIASPRPRQINFQDLPLPVDSCELAALTNRVEAEEEHAGRAAVEFLRLVLVVKELIAQIAAHVVAKRVIESRGKTSGFDDYVRIVW